MMDARCLEHDHHFDMCEIYDEDTGEPMPREMQLAAKCTRPGCGITMGDSLKVIVAECEQLIAGKEN